MLLLAEPLRFLYHLVLPLIKTIQIKHQQVQHPYFNLLFLSPSRYSARTASWIRSNSVDVAAFKVIPPIKECNSRKLLEQQHSHCTGRRKRTWCNGALQETSPHPRTWLPSRKNDENCLKDRFFAPSHHRLLTSVGGPVECLLRCWVVRTSLDTDRQPSQIYTLRSSLLEIRTD